MGKRLAVLVLIVLVVAAPDTAAAASSRAYTRQLPDSAFAVIESSRERTPIRHLRHHHTTGILDLPHLCNALARLPQVKWRDPPNAAIARRHLKAHVNQVGRGACRPLPRPKS
jgi:hypothetical protein